MIILSWHAGHVIPVLATNNGKEMHPDQHPLRFSVARNIVRELKNQPRQEFKYINKGQMTAIGKSSAIVESGKLKLSGLLPGQPGYLFIFTA